jgi:Uma2 family endonuclease
MLTNNKYILLTYCLNITQVYHFKCVINFAYLLTYLAIFKWSRIPFDTDGEAPNDFRLHPDWIIEILSPEQSSNRVIGNILYCLQYGCQLGWLIDPADRSVLVFQANQQPQLLQGSDRLYLCVREDPRLCRRDESNLTT